MKNKLDTGIKNIKNVSRLNIGNGCLQNLVKILNPIRLNSPSDGSVVYFIDSFFENNELLGNNLGAQKRDKIKYIDVGNEPTTEQIDALVKELKQNVITPIAVVGIGGGSVMDISKAVSNLLTNPGSASDYQGWDLLMRAGVIKIGIPTISGTGAEATRTCVMTNKETGLKLGMNSDYSVFDYLLLDPCLTKSVPRNQFFYTGMDAYIHCMESLSGQYRNPLGDAYSNQVISLCREIFLSQEMMSDANRERLMVASYLGGCAIATTYVGVVHPFSAALSVVLGIHHCLANCIVMRGMEAFYNDGFIEFWGMVNAQKISIPEGICRDLSDEIYLDLYRACMVHEKPLINALGEDYEKILTFELVKSVFQKM